jgi:hypothetical protein
MSLAIIGQEVFEKLIESLIEAVKYPKQASLGKINKK